MTEQETYHPEAGKPADEEETTLKPLFSLGQVVGTPGALDALEEAGQHPLTLLARHVVGDWGELGRRGSGGE